MNSLMSRQEWAKGAGGHEDVLSLQNKSGSPGKIMCPLTSINQGRADQEYVCNNCP